MAGRGAWGLAALAAAALFVIGWLAFRQPPAVRPRATAIQVVTTPPDDAFTRFLPLPLRTLGLGMPILELRKQRPRAVAIAQLGEAGLLAYGEPLSAETQAIYLFDARTRLLARVQVAAQLGGVSDIEPRIHELEGLYGAPSGIWDCLASTPPTRRFAWFRGRYGLVEAFLLAGPRVAATRYVAGTETLRASLASGRCSPVAPEHLSKFPVSPPTH